MKHQRHSPLPSRVLRLTGATLLVMVLCTFPSHHTQAGEAGVILLPPGIYHQDEVTAKPGPGWLALVDRENGGGPRLEPATLVIEAAHDALVDDHGEATGKRVTVAGGGPDPILLLAGGHGLRPSAVLAATPKEAVFTSLEPLRLTLDGQVYELGYQLAHVPKPDDPPGEPKQGSLVLRSGDVSQTIAEFLLWCNLDTGNVTFIGDDAFTHLLWAGDLDGDGRLDLYIDLTDHYNVTHPTLLLSSAAAPEELLAQVASHLSVGC